MVPIFQVKKLRSLARTQPRSPGDSEAENLGLMLFMRALLRDDTAAVCCWTLLSLVRGGCLWVRASVDRPSPVQSLEE